MCRKGNLWKLSLNWWTLKRRGRTRNSLSIFTPEILPQGTMVLLSTIFVLSTRIFSPFPHISSWHWQQTLVACLAVESISWPTFDQQSFDWSRNGCVTICKEWKKTKSMEWKIKSMEWETFQQAMYVLCETFLWKMVISRTVISAPNRWNILIRGRRNYPNFIRERRSYPNFIQDVFPPQFRHHFEKTLNRD